MKPKFDGYAAQYDAWFMENENLFQSELRLFQKVLGDIQGKRCFPWAAAAACSRHDRLQRYRRH